MKKMITCLLTAFGLISCGQKGYESVDVPEFAKLADAPDVVLLDVRTAAEFADGHLEGAINLDQGQDGFVEAVRQMVPDEMKIAVYCQSGRRSASAAERLATEGYRCVNLNGGIKAWMEAGLAVAKDAYEVDVLRTKSGKKVRLTALMHASIRIDYDGKVLLIDPVSKLGNREVDYAAMSKADYLLVTHEHGDHFDADALRTLSSEQTQLITNKRCADMFGAGVVMANGDSMQISDDIAVRAVPAYNTTEGHLQFHPQGRDNGYVLTLDGLHIYIAGDTEDIPEMSALGDVDVAFLPCNQPYTMTTEQLLNAARMVKPKVLFPYHYGQTDVSDVPRLLKGDGIEVRIRHYE